MPNILEKFADPIFEAAQDFLCQAKEKILIHCNQGISRSPALTLVHLAKQDIISKDSYTLAHKEFYNLYPSYAPGVGITNYLRERWDYLMSK